MDSATTMAQAQREYELQYLSGASGQYEKCPDAPIVDAQDGAISLLNQWGWSDVRVSSVDQDGQVIYLVARTELSEVTTYSFRLMAQAA